MHIDKHIQRAKNQELCWKKKNIIIFLFVSCPTFGLNTELVSAWPTFNLR